LYGHSFSRLYSTTSIVWYSSIGHHHPDRPFIVCECDCSSKSSLSVPLVRRLLGVELESGVAAICDTDSIDGINDVLSLSLAIGFSFEMLLPADAFFLFVRAVVFFFSPFVVLLLRALPGRTSDDDDDDFSSVLDELERNINT
jgi:hypothetical protein